MRDTAFVEYEDLSRLLGDDIVRLTQPVSRPIEVLEAGCGRGWNLEISDRPIRVTGADTDQDALDYRIQVKKDLDLSMVGDIRDRDLVGAAQFDVVYSSYVLEHIDGAEQAMKNFVDWLRPGGILVVKIPDGDTVFGFLGKRLPHRVHIFYARWFQGIRNAGQPGYGPYRTVYDPIVSLKALHRFCETRGMTIERVYKTGFFSKRGLKWRAVRIAMWVLGRLSLGRLDASYNDIAVVIRMPGSLA
ncbi:MAG TPA: class I SAM-dependent methyltransferase [Acidimicrobiales bacterium]|nr:class I SAM-dependent methyltransferase [Acidimicrobiales bacterium]